MAINKVEYGNETLIDLTSDTVTKETLIKGETAHTASGEKIYGEFDPDVYLKKSGGDAKDVVLTFNSSDTDDSVSEWTSVSVLSSGEKLSSLFNKISTMFRNIRYLYKLIGSTDISELSEDGTITKSLTTLNRKLGSLIKEGSFTATTNANGAITAGDSGVSATDKIVLQAFVPSYLAYAYISESTTAYGFKIVNTVNNNPYANQSVTVTYYYIEK